MAEVTIEEQKIILAGKTKKDDSEIHSGYILVTPKADVYLPGTKKEPIREIRTLWMSDDPYWTHVKELLAFSEREKTEVWVEYYEDDMYLISNLGRVYSRIVNRVLNTFDIDGYRKLSLRKNPNLAVHRLVAKHYILNTIAEREVVNHKDLNRANNHVWNLEWVTYSENSQHSADTRTDRNKKARVISSAPPDGKPIPGWANYLITPRGEVYSVRSRCLLHGYTNRYGYKTVKLSPDKTFKMFRVHRLVMLTFIGPCPSLHVVDHIDSNPSNNHLSNLRYVTFSQNTQASYDNGALTAKLSPVIMIDPENKEILAEFKSLAHLTSEYGIGHSNIGFACQSGGTCFGYEWKYKKSLSEEELLDLSDFQNNEEFLQGFQDRMLSTPKKEMGRETAVAMYEFDTRTRTRGRLLITFSSQVEAEFVTNIDRRGIGNTCRSTTLDTRESTGGYTWKYLKDLTQAEEDELEKLTEEAIQRNLLLITDEILRPDQNRNRRVVMVDPVTNLGLAVFDSVTIAATASGTPRTSLSDVVRHSHFRACSTGNRHKWSYIQDFVRHYLNPAPASVTQDFVDRIKRKGINTL